jgi:hypothetical protein
VHGLIHWAFGELRTASRGYGYGYGYGYSYALFPRPADYYNLHTVRSFARTTTIPLVFRGDTPRDDATDAFAPLD